MIVGISGHAGAGKDTIADRLVEQHGFVRVGFADPMKRFCQEVFDFTDEQVWGTIEHKNRPDPRYPRVVERGLRGDVCEYLAPRYALQTLGTEWGRDCYPNLWIDYALRVARTLLGGGWQYDSREGLCDEPGAFPVQGVVFSDCRFANEIEAVKRAGGVIVRVVRPGFGGEVGIAGHRSEAEQRGIPDAEFDHVIHNAGTLEDLAAEVDRLAEAWAEKGRAA